MSTSQSSPPPEPLLAPPPSRSPWQAFYRFVHRQRHAFYKERRATLPAPVVSVGNLHWGGTGKTPIVAAVASRLQAGLRDGIRNGGHRVAVLSRGYGRKEGGVKIVSRGDGPLLGPSLAGDEPVLLAGLLPGVAVVVAKERILAGEHALERLSPPPDLFVLDDGFSHLQLNRTIDLLVFPRNDPYGGGRLAPSGRLREPLEAAGRADAVLLSGGAPGEGTKLAETLRPYGFEGPGFSVELTAQSARTETGEPLEAGTGVLLVTGIARPARVEASAVEQGVAIRAKLAFADHHRYPERSLARIRKAFDESAAEYVLTTAKDAVKLRGRIDLPMAELPLVAEVEDDFWPWLDQALGTAP